MRMIHQDDPRVMLLRRSKGESFQKNKAALPALVFLANIPLRMLGNIYIQLH